MLSRLLFACASCSTILFKFLFTEIYWCSIYHGVNDTHFPITNSCYNELNKTESLDTKNITHSARLISQYGL